MPPILFFTLTVLHNKSTNLYCNILQNLDIWWMNVFFVLWLLPTFSAPPLPPPFQAHTFTSTHTLEVFIAGSSFWFVDVAFLYYSMLSLSNPHSSNETRLTYLSFRKPFRGLFHCSQHSSTWSCHSIFCWGWDYIIFIFVTWSLRQSVQITVSNQHIFAHILLN